MPDGSRNPFKSEAEMFRVLVVVLAAAAPVVAAGLVAGPGPALIALGVELGVGGALLWRASRRRRGAPGATGS